MTTISQETRTRVSGIPPVQKAASVRYEVHGILHIHLKFLHHSVFHVIYVQARVFMLQDQYVTTSTSNSNEFAKIWQSIGMVSG